MRRGLTLIEVLAALCALSLLMIAAAGWTAVVARAASDASKRAAWEIPARRTLQLVSDDIASGDAFGDAWTQRVDASSNGLAIQTRDARGASLHTYVLESQDLMLETPEGRSVILSEVDFFGVTVDTETRALEVTLRHVNGAQFVRRMPAP